MTWPLVTVDQIKAKTRYSLVGGPFGSNLVTTDYREEGVPVIRGNNVPGDKAFSFDDLAFVSEEKADQLLPNNAFPGDLVVTQRGTLGQVGLIPVDSPYSRFVISQSQMKLTVNAQIASARFVYYYFCLPQSIQRIKNQAITSGVPHINLEILKRFELPLPSLREQERIAAILTAYDDLIENNRRRIYLLEQAARLIYQEWFVRLRFPGHEQVPVVDGVPEGWERATLQDLADLVMGQSPESKYYNEDGVGLPFHQGVTDFGERFVTHTKYCTAEGRVAQPGDILCSVRAPVGRLNLTNDKVVIGRGLASIRSKKGHQSFLYYQLKGYFFKEDMIGEGSIFAAVTRQQLASQPLLAPRDSLVEQYESYSKPIDAQIGNLVRQNSDLRQARDLLLPKLMSGEIEV